MRRPMEKDTDPVTGVCRHSRGCVAALFFADEADGRRVYA